MTSQDEQQSADKANTVNPEYILIGALLLIGALAVPAMQNVYLVQSLVLSICTGLGIQ